MPQLSMPLYVSVADCVLRMQLDGTLMGITDVVSSGIIGAQLHVQRVLDGKFQRQSWDCVYFCDAQAFSGLTPGGVFRLEIPSRFVRRDTPIVVSSSIAVTDSVDPGPFGDFEVVASTYYHVDYDRGYILLSNSYANCYVRVQCDTGYEDGTTPTPVTGIADFDETVAYEVGDLVVSGGVVWKCTTATLASPPPEPAPSADLTHWALSYVEMEQIPTDVYEAIMSYIPMTFNQSQTTNRSNEAKEQYQAAADHAAILLQPWLRLQGFTYRPIWKS